LLAEDLPPIEKGSHTSYGKIFKGFFKFFIWSYPWPPKKEQRLITTWKFN
jgi:hypothetical protein